MTSINTSSPGLPGRTLEPPPLAHSRPLQEYQPRYGDYVVWAGWFSTWHGFIVGIDKERDELHIVFAGLPALLVTMEPDELDGETRKVKLSDIRRAARGAYAIETLEGQNRVWYI